MYQQGDSEGWDDQPPRDPDDDEVPDRFGMLAYLESIPEPTDSRAPDPSLGDLLLEAELPGGCDRLAAEARQRDPGPLTALMLSVLTPARLGPAGNLDAACAADRLASWTQAQQHGHLAAFARPGTAAPIDQLLDYASAPGQPLHQNTPAARTTGTGTGTGTGASTERDLASSGSATHGRPEQEKAALTHTAVKVAAAELSAALLISPINANRRVAQAVEFTDDLPATLTALRDGVIDRGRALLIADRTQNLPTDLRRRVEATVAAKAVGRTAGQLRGIADRAVIAVDPAAAKKRHDAAKACREISIRPAEDGMSILRATLTADKSVTAFTVIDQIATANARHAGEKRSIGALRADVFTDIFDQLATQGSVHLFPPGTAGKTPCPHHPMHQTGPNGTVHTDTGSTGTDSPATHPTDHDTPSTDDNGPTTEDDPTTDDNGPTTGDDKPSARDQSATNGDHATVSPNVADTAPHPATHPAMPADTAEPSDSAEPTDAATCAVASPTTSADTDEPGNSPETADAANKQVSQTGTDQFGKSPITDSPTTADAAANPAAETASNPADSSATGMPSGPDRAHPDDPANSSGNANHGDSGTPIGPNRALPDDPPLPENTSTTNESGQPDPTTDATNPLLRHQAAPPCQCHQSGSSTTPTWGLGTHQGRTTSLNVTIAASTLHGLDDLPGELDGHGPIPADMARTLAASAATITAIAVNPACGTALDLGRTAYRPRQAQRDRVTQRDGTCRFVGCRQPAWRCQIDHSNEYCPGRTDGGITCPCNLACLCKFHHDLKTFGLWDTIHHPDDSITWISPNQRHYTSQPREWFTGLADDCDVADADGPPKESSGQNPSMAKTDDPPPF